MEGISHAVCQVLVGEELHRHMHHTVAKGLRVLTLHQHDRDAAVVLHEGPGKGILKQRQRKAEWCAEWALSTILPLYPKILVEVTFYKYFHGFSDKLRFLHY